MAAVNHSIFSLRHGNDVTKLLAASYWIWTLLLRMLLLYADAVFGVSSIQLSVHNTVAAVPRAEEKLLSS